MSITQAPASGVFCPPVSGPAQSGSPQLARKAHWPSGDTATMQNEYASIHGKRSAMKWFSLERAMPVLFILGYAVFFAVQVGGAHMDALWAQAQAFFASIADRFQN